MIRTPRRLALLAAALPLVLVPLATTGAAEAATWQHRDATRDVLRLSMTEDVEDGRPDPADASADIRRIAVRHTGSQVRIDLGYRDLRGGDSMLAASLVTPGGRYELTAMRSPDLRMLMLMPVDADGSASGSSEEEYTDCRGKRIRYDAKKDTITVAIPRSCLGDPEWVRVGAIFIAGNLTTLEDDSPLFYDDALRKGGGLRAMGGPKLGPKVRVG